MSEHEKNKKTYPIYFDEFTNANEENRKKIAGKFKKIDIDLINSETTTFNAFDTDSLILGKTKSGKCNPFNPMLVAKILNREEIKTIIHGFYKNNHSLLDELLSDESTADEGDRWIIFQLQRDLAYKSQFEGFSEAENLLLHLLLNSSGNDLGDYYSSQLICEFKNVLKEVEE